MLHNEIWVNYIDVYLLKCHYINIKQQDKE